MPPRFFLIALTLVALNVSGCSHPGPGPGLSPVRPAFSRLVAEGPIAETPFEKLIKKYSFLAAEVNGHPATLILDLGAPVDLVLPADSLERFAVQPQSLHVDSLVTERSLNVTSP